MKNKLKKFVGSIITASAVGLLSATAVLALNGYTLYGGAEYKMPGFNSLRAVELVSDLSTPDTSDDFSGIDFTVPAGLTFADLTVLSTDYNVTDDDCGGGSPRFQINVDTGSGIKNIFAYIGPEPNYTGCLPNMWVNSTDLLEVPHFVDTSQVGGTFYDPYPNAVLNYGSYPVVGIQLVNDSGWFAGDGEMTHWVDNVMINDALYDFEPTKEDCKKGGWEDLVDKDGNSFKNQGDCVSYFATGGKNPGDGL